MSDITDLEKHLEDKIMNNSVVRGTRIALGITCLAGATFLAVIFNDSGKLSSAIQKADEMRHQNGQTLFIQKTSDGEKVTAQFKSNGQLEDVKMVQSTQAAFMMSGYGAVALAALGALAFPKKRPKETAPPTPSPST